MSRRLPPRRPSRRMTSERRRDVDYLGRFARDPAVCGGEPVIKGTRVFLRTVLASLAEGATPAEILRDFPTLAEE